jgi:hypothetical protein
LNEKAGEALRNLIHTLSGGDGAGVDTVEDDGTGVCKYAPEGILMEDGRIIRENLPR